MDIIRVTFTGNIEKVYIDPKTCGSACFKSSLKVCDNYGKIDWTGVNHAVVSIDPDGKMHISQANGYTADDGMFTRLY